MKGLLIIFKMLLLVTGSLQAHSIVFIHIGVDLPPYLSTSVTQARLFNEECPIFLIANEATIKKASPELLSNNVSFIPCESLHPSPIHIQFQNYPSHNMTASGLWRYSSERFFYLEEFIRQYNLIDVFHLETDIMLYADLQDLLPVFQKYYNGMIAATFENDTRCVAGFLYISNLKPMETLINFFPADGSATQTDMETFAFFKDQYHKTLIDHLPIVVKKYSLDHPLQAKTRKEPSKEPACYSNHIDEFGVLFDAAAFGIYLAGWDSRYHEATGPGHITPHNIFDPSFFKIDWIIDSKGRKIPLITYQGKQTPIVNLHITNKSMIKDFHSLNN